MAAALATMVAGISREKKAYVQYEPQLSQALARLAQLREELKAAIDADAESYNKVLAAYRQAKAFSDGDAVRLIDSALKDATTVPFQTAQKAREVAAIVASLGPITNPNMASDLTVAGVLAQAAIQGALANVEVNLRSLKDAGFASDMRSKIAGLRG
jgi:formiminotetrahydrofolate cyclodeaminase